MMSMQFKTERGNMIELASPALFLGVLFFLFSQLLVMVYLGDALRGASLRTLIACLCINTSSSVILYFSQFLSPLPVWQNYIGAMWFIIAVQDLFWLWWLAKKHQAHVTSILIGIAELLALGAYYGLRAYAHVVKN